MQTRVSHTRSLICRYKTTIVHRWINHFANYSTHSLIYCLNLEKKIQMALQKNRVLLSIIGDEVCFWRLITKGLCHWTFACRCWTH